MDRNTWQESLVTGKIAGAGLNVYWEEPPDPNDPVISYNVPATRPIARSTDHSMRGIIKKELLKADAEIGYEAANGSRRMPWWSWSIGVGSQPISRPQRWPV